MGFAIVNSNLEAALAHYIDQGLADLPGYALRRAANAMMAELTDRLSEVDMRISHVSVLLLVGKRRDLKSSEIGRALDIQRANMVPLVGRLEAMNLVERIPLDRKSQAIALTPQGFELLARIREITDRFEADLMARIPKQHRKHLIPALNALWRTD